MKARKVMLVDDEPDIGEMVRLCLEAGGRFAVKVAGSGQEALALASREPPDVLLLDAMMPGLDGPELLGRLRQQPGCGATPVVFLTARSDQPYLDRLWSLGAAGVIAKPFDPLTLAEELGRQLVSAGQG